jgi:TonB family protein
MNPNNVLSYFAQVGFLIVICASLPRVLGLRSPSLHHVFWRTLLALCLMLPVIEPRQPAKMVFVPAPVQAGAAAAGLPPAPRPAPAEPPFDWVRATSILLVAGILARLGWIGVGLLRLQRLRQRAVEPALGFEDLQQTIGAFAPIRWSAEATHPVTFGVVRPIVVLPYVIKSVDAAAQRAVVAHELHHVKRRDWLWTIVEEIVRSVFWFHPAMWWLISRVQLARETVVDELSILTTNARRAYLDTLLAFADDTGLRSTTAFSARRHLFHRVMLLSKEGGMSSIRVATASCVLMVALAGGSLEAVHAFPLHVAQGQIPPPPPPPPQAQTAAAYCVVAHHYLEIVQNDTTLTTDERLETIRKGIAVVDRALDIDPQYVSALAYKNVFLHLQANLTEEPRERDRLLREADSLRAEAIKLRKLGVQDPVDPSAPPPPPPPPPPGGADMVFVPKAVQHTGDASNPVRIGGDIKQPLKIRDVRLMYPPIARDAGVSGVVVVEVLIDSAGDVAEAHILRSIPLLDQAALDAVKQWRFVPTLVNGEPRAAIMTVTVNFTPQ